MPTGGKPFVEELPEEVWTGELLDGKYQFERPLATSSMAIVVIARHLELDERVAIKFLSPHAVRSSGALARFRREARAAARIKNQHVVRIIDAATTKTSVPYIVMEYLDGMDLERQLAQYPERKAPIPDIVDFILQASEAIAEGHQLEIVHRDLKPANLFCSDRGDGYPMIKVLDFGISKVRSTIGDVDRTDQHEILGSPRYMSPEQIDSSRDVDHRTDIWSLGVILYEGLTGAPPFNAETIPELWRRIRGEAPQDVRRLRPECPVALAEAVMRCLQKEPEKRFPDLGALATALTVVAPERSRASIARIQWTMVPATTGSTRPSAFAVEFEQATTARVSSRKPWLIASGILVSVALGLGVLARSSLHSDASGGVPGAMPSAASRMERELESPAPPKAQPGITVPTSGDEPVVTPVPVDPGTSVTTTKAATPLGPTPLGPVTKGPTANVSSGNASNGTMAATNTPSGMSAKASGATSSGTTNPAVGTRSFAGKIETGAVDPPSGGASAPAPTTQRSNVSSDAPNAESPPWRVPPVDRRK